MPPLILAILSGIQLAAQYAPEARKVWENARGVFALLFAGGLITAEQQTRLSDWAEAHEAATLAGQVPPEFMVEPDPAS